MTFRSKKLRDAAQHYNCVLCGASGTTVAAHANSVALGKGTGIKAPDYYIAFVCHRCHDMIDGRIKLDPVWTSVMECWTFAYLRTVKLWFDSGLVKVH